MHHEVFWSRSVQEKHLCSPNAHRVWAWIRLVSNRQTWTTNSENRPHTNLSQPLQTSSLSQNVSKLKQLSLKATILKLHYKHRASSLLGTLKQTKLLFGSVLFNSFKVLRNKTKKLLWFFFFFLICFHHLVTGPFLKNRLRWFPRNRTPHRFPSNFVYWLFISRELNFWNKKGRSPYSF